MDTFIAVKTYFKLDIIIFEIEDMIFCQQGAIGYDAYIASIAVRAGDFLDVSAETFEFGEPE